MTNTIFLLERFRPSYLAGLAWVPAVALCAGRLALRPRAAHGAALGALLAVQLLTGSPQIACYEVWLLAGAALAVLLTKRGRRLSHATRILVGAGIAAVTAAALAAVQILPTVELVLGAVRGPAGLPLDVVQPPRPTPQWLLAIATASGLAVLVIPCALLEGRRRAVVVAAAIVALVAGLVGAGTPLYRDVFYHLPGVALFRWPQVVVVLGWFAGALLAGIGLDAVRRRRTPARWNLVVLVPLALGTVLVATLVPPGTVRRLGVGLLLALAALAWWRRPALAWAVVALVAMERTLAAGNSVMTPQHLGVAAFEPTPFARFLQAQEGHGRTLLRKTWRRRFPFMEKLGSLWGIDVVQDYEPLVPAIYHRALAGFAATNPDKPLFMGRFFPNLADTAAWRILDVLAVRWVLVETGVPVAPVLPPRWRLAWQDGEARVYENRKALPRAWLVDRIEVAAGQDAALERVLAPAFDPRSTAVTEEAIAVGGPTPGDASPGTADVRRIAGGAATVKVDAAHRALLVLADLHWPGWTATVDGRPATVHRVNAMLRGVVVDAGAHVVEMRFASRALRAGATVSALALLVLAAWALRARSRRVSSTRA